MKANLNVIAHSAPVTNGMINIKDFKWCKYMKADKEKLKNANYVDILREIATVTEELDNMMYPPSWARTNELVQYKKELLEELDRRK